MGRLVGAEAADSQDGSPVESSLADLVETDEAAPHAAALIESLRSFGYSPETAIADLLDNSISARARRIEIDFHWAEHESHVSVWDNGRGMSEARLFEAMRPGSFAPSDERAATDLGRFGLGLKTASFSQARELTVLTRDESEQMTIRRWDLDYVAQTGRWLLKRSPSMAAKDMADRVSAQGGTAVVWTKCDHLIRDLDVDISKAHDRFLATASSVARHLGMTFHRFMVGPGAIKITVNGSPVVPWDPILKHPATQRVGGEVELHPYGGSAVAVAAYVLPHRSKLSEAEQALGAGTRGWTAMQGFYVYRNNRLMVAGDWLGVGGAKDEHTKLARITVDFDSRLDQAWQIDVKKSTARPPGALVAELTRIARFTRRAAEDVYRYRGGPIARRRKSTEPLVLAWQEVKTRDGELRLRVNRQHPVISEALSGAPVQKRAVSRVLSFLEETIPTNWIGVRVAEALDTVGGPYSPDEHAVSALLAYSFGVLVDAGTKPDQALDSLSVIEPFAAFPHLIQVLREGER